MLFYYLNDFVVVYLDYTVINSRTLDEHVNHLSMVVSGLRKYTLYVKMEKYEFAQQEIELLGRLVSKKQFQMEPKKLKVIVDWQSPCNVKDLRSFLGLVNYNKKFTVVYSKRIATLNDLLKKDAKWVWVVRCE